MDKVLQIAATAAGLAGIATIVFYYIFRDVIRKLILPRLTQEHAYRVIRLILGLTFSLAIVGIAAWTAVQFKTAAGLHPSSPRIAVRIRQAEHVFFIAYPPDESALPGSTPDYSMLRQGGAYVTLGVMHSVFLPPLDEGTKFGRWVVLPQGEAVYDFIVTNFGGTTTIADRISLELVDVEPLPQSVFGGFLPALKPYKDTATVHRDQLDYTLFYDQVFAYEAGKSDLYRVNVKIADAEEPGIYRLRLRVDHTSEGQRSTAYSDSFLIAKYFGGPTDRNVYAKFHPDDAPPRDTRPAALMYVDGLDTHKLPNLYTTGKYVSQLTAWIPFPIPGLEPPQKTQCNKTEYASPEKSDEAIWAALMSGDRKPVQVYGYVLDDKPPSEDQLAASDFDQPHGSRSATDQSFRFGVLKNNIHVYEQRTTAEYECALKMVVDVAIRGEPSYSGRLGELLYEMSERSDLDIAGLLDLMPLLAFIDQARTLSRIADLLASKNVLVQRKATALLEQYRYSPASDRLLNIFLNSPTASKAAAGRALVMCSDDETLKKLMALVLAPNANASTLSAIAPLIVQIAPAEASRLIKSPDTNAELRAALAESARR